MTCLKLVPGTRIVRVRDRREKSHIVALPLFQDEARPDLMQERFRSKLSGVPEKYYAIGNCAPNEMLGTRS